MHFKPQIQESLPYEKAAKDFYRKKDLNKLIVLSMKRKDSPHKKILLKRRRSHD